MTVPLSQRLLRLQGAISNDSEAVPQSIIDYKGWMPDRAALGNPGELEATNVRPTEDGYGPLGDQNPQATALDARCQGAAAISSSEGVVTTYAGDATKLYSVGPEGTPVDVSSAAYTTAADEQWEFASFGSTFIATNRANPVQGITVGGSAFADLITSVEKPKARHVDVVRDFVVLGNVESTADGEKTNRVHWSAYRDATNFTPTAGNQGDFEDIEEGGWVQRIVGGVEYGLIFQERQITRMSYIGPPIVFQLDTIDRKRGTPIPGSVVAFGRLVFFYSDDGFMMNDGVQTIPIGHRAVDRKFNTDFNTTYIGRCFSAIDPINKVVMWSLPGENQSTPGEPNRIYMFNWAENRWAEAELDLQLVYRALTPGLTLEDLDSVSTDLDALPFSLDSRAWTGGSLIAGSFNSDNRLCHFSGANLAATIDTGERQLFRGQKAEVTGARPIVDGGTPTVTVGSRQSPQGSNAFGSAVAVDATGFSSQLVEGRYHRMRTIVPAASSWTHAQGVEVFANGTGVQ
jgi:hypothetical protein